MAENQQMSTEKTPKNAKKFYCEKCDFGCNRFSEYKRHIDTKKHKSTNVNRKTPKNTKKFYCEKCDFGCNRFAKYKRHIDTKKHKSTENQQEKHQTIILSIWRKKDINFTAKYFRDLKIGHF